MHLSRTLNFVCSYAWAPMINTLICKGQAWLQDQTLKDACMYVCTRTSNMGMILMCLQCRVGCRNISGQAIQQLAVNQSQIVLHNSIRCTLHTHTTGVHPKHLYISHKVQWKAGQFICRQLTLCCKCISIVPRMLLHVHTYT